MIKSFNHFINNLCFLWKVTFFIFFYIVNISMPTYYTGGKSWSDSKRRSGGSYRSRGIVRETKRASSWGEFLKAKAEAERRRRDYVSTKDVPLTARRDSAFNVMMREGAGVYDTKTGVTIVREDGAKQTISRGDVSRFHREYNDPKSKYYQVASQKRLGKTVSPSDQLGMQTQPKQLRRAERPQIKPEAPSPLQPSVQVQGKDLYVGGVLSTGIGGQIDKNDKQLSTGRVTDRSGASAGSVIGGVPSVQKEKDQGLLAGVRDKLISFGKGTVKGQYVYPLYTIGKKVSKGQPFFSSVKGAYGEYWKSPITDKDVQLASKVGAYGVGGVALGAVTKTAVTLAPALSKPITGAGLALLGAFGIQTGVEVAKAPTRYEKGQILTERGLEFIGGSAGYRGVRGSTPKAKPFRSQPKILNDLPPKVKSSVFKFDIKAKAPKGDGVFVKKTDTYRLFRINPKTRTVKNPLAPGGVKRVPVKGKYFLEVNRAKYLRLGQFAYEKNFGTSPSRNPFVFQQKTQIKRGRFPTDPMMTGKPQPKALPRGTSTLFKETHGYKELRFKYQGEEVIIRQNKPTVKVKPKEERNFLRELETGGQKQRQKQQLLLEEPKPKTRAKTKKLTLFQERPMARPKTKALTKIKKYNLDTEMFGIKRLKVKVKPKALPKKRPRLAFVNIFGAPKAGTETVQRIFSSPAQSSKTTTKTSTASGTASATSITQALGTSQATSQSVAQSQAIGVVSPVVALTTLSYFTASKPPKLPKMGRDLGGATPRRRSYNRKKKPGFKYMPSLYATAFEVYGKAPKSFKGWETRPLTGKPKKTKVRKKNKQTWQGVLRGL